MGTHLYITESHSIHVFLCLFIMIIYHKTKCIKEIFIYIMKCYKGHNFVICCVALSQLKFFWATSDKIGLWDPSSLAVWKLDSLCWKFLFQKYCYVVFISVKNFKTLSYTQCFFACSTPNTSAYLWNPFCPISDHYPLQAKQGLLGFLLFASVLGISWGRCKSTGIATVPCVSFCALWHQTGGLFSEQFIDPSVIK